MVDDHQPRPLGPGKNIDRGDGRSLRRVRLTAAILAVALALWWAGRALAPRLLTIIAGIRGIGAAAPIAFMLIYAVAVHSSHWSTFHSPDIILPLLIGVWLIVKGALRLASY